MNNKVGRDREHRTAGLELQFEQVPASLQQEESMSEGLRILASWLIRRARREQGRPSAASEPTAEAA